MGGRADAAGRRAETGPDPTLPPTHTLAHSSRRQRATGAHASAPPPRAAAHAAACAHDGGMEGEGGVGVRLRAQVVSGGECAWAGRARARGAECETRRGAPPAVSTLLHSSSPFIMQLARLAPSPRPGAVARRPRGAPVAAKPTKAADFRGLEADALDAAVAESRRALFDLRIAQRTRQVRVVGVARGGGGVARRGAARRRPPARRGRTPPPPLPPPSRHAHFTRAGLAGAATRGPRGAAGGGGAAGGRRARRGRSPARCPSPPGIQAVRLWLAQDQGVEGVNGAGWRDADADARRPPTVPRPPSPPYPTPPQIAQLLTIKRERTLAAGVGKRDARKAEKKEKVDAGFGQF